MGTGGIGYWGNRDGECSSHATVSKGSMLRGMLLPRGGKVKKYTFLTPGEGVSYETHPMGEGTTVPSLEREIPEEGVSLGKGREVRDGKGDKGWDGMGWDGNI